MAWRSSTFAKRACALASCLLALLPPNVAEARSGCGNVDRHVEFCGDMTDLITRDQIMIKSAIAFDYRDQKFKLSVSSGPAGEVGPFSDTNIQWLGAMAASGRVIDAARLDKTEEGRSKNRRFVRSWFRNRVWSSRRASIVTIVLGEERNLYIATGRDTKEHELIDLQAHMILSNAFRLDEERR